MAPPRHLIPFLLCFVLLSACNYAPTLNTIQENIPQGLLNLIITPTPTDSDSGSEATPQPNLPKYSFHINFMIDEKISACAGTAKCDYAILPKMAIYLRGDVHALPKNALDGTGKMIITSIDPCTTFLTDSTSCQVNSVSDGSFSVSGSEKEGKLVLTLHIKTFPRVSVTYKSNTPGGNTNLPSDSTYPQEIKLMFDKSGLFEKALELDPNLNDNKAAAYFEGTGVFGKRSLHGKGELFFIPFNTFLPGSFKP